MKLLITSFFVAGLALVGLGSYKSLKVHGTVTGLFTVPLFDNSASPVVPSIVGNVAPSSKLEVRRINLDLTNTILLADEVNEQTSAAVIEQLISLDSNTNKDPIYLVMYSPGGSVIDGAQIINAMQASKRPVYTVCVKICASMAAIIHSYGVKRLMADRSILMHHNASGGARGPVPSMLNMLGMLSKYVDEMEVNVARRAGMTVEEYRVLRSNELWLTSRETLDKGFADELVFITGGGSSFRGFEGKSFKIREKRFFLDWK